MVLFLLEECHINLGEDDLVPQHNFNGEFNGNGYKIYNLKIEQTLIGNENYFYSGFFNANCGIIKNLFIEKATSNVTINSLKFSAVGLLSGINKGEIFNCYTSGELKYIKNSSASSNIGGLVGSNVGKIKYCYNTTNVNASYQDITEVTSEARVGGLVGVNETAGLIENSYNTGNVSSENLSNTENTFSIYIGGFVGMILGEIKNSYTTGIVTSIDSNNLNSYRIGSLVGLNYSSSITNCYYLPNTVFPPRDDIQVTIGGEEKTAEYMKQNDFINDLNKGNETNIWKINSTVNQGYPILYWQ